MKGKKKKILSLDEYLASDKKHQSALKYKQILKDAEGDSENEEKLISDLKLNVGKYSLRTRIKTSSWLKSGRPATKAQKWLFQEVMRNPAEYRYGKLLMYQGGLFMFQYKNPKYKGTAKLPWFDKYPLVLSLGPVVTKQGIRNLGFNLHLLPPKIRIVVLCQVFEMYKKLYRYQIFFMKNRPVQIRYQHIVKALRKYGVTFSVRMYIPRRQREIVCFPYKVWYKAVFIPSSGYDSIKAAKLIQEWTKFIRREGSGIRANADWKHLI